MHGDSYLKQPVIGTLQDVVITYGTLIWLLRGAPLDLSPGLVTTQSEEVDHGNG